MLRVLKGTDIVFHHASPPVAVSDHSLFYKVNVEGTRKLIEACKESGVEGTGKGCGRGCGLVLRLVIIVFSVFV